MRVVEQPGQHSALLRLATDPRARVATAAVKLVGSSMAAQATTQRRSQQRSRQPHRQPPQHRARDPGATPRAQWAQSAPRRGRSGSLPPSSPQLRYHGADLGGRNYQVQVHIVFVVSACSEPSNMRCALRRLQCLSNVCRGSVESVNRAAGQQYSLNRPGLGRSCSSLAPAPRPQAPASGCCQSRACRHTSLRSSPPRAFEDYLRAYLAVGDGHTAPAARRPAC